MAFGLVERSGPTLCEPRAGKNPMIQSPEESEIDEAAATALAMQVTMYSVGEAMVEMGYLGHKLGIYGAMQDLGPASPAEIAHRAGLHERWVLEWLRSQCFAGLVTADADERFHLTPTQAAVVADTGSRFYRGTAWQNVERNAERRSAVLDAFRTGVGKSSWAGRDPAEFPGVLEEFQRDTLVSAVLPARRRCCRGPSWWRLFRRCGLRPWDRPPRGRRCLPRRAGPRLGPMA